MADQDLPNIMHYSSDVTDAPAPEPLPKGTYPAVVQGASIKQSRQNVNNRYFEVLFKIDPEDFPADFSAEEYPDGITIAYRRVPAADTPRGKYLVGRFLRALGTSGGTDVDCGDWSGLKVQATVDHDVDPEGMPQAIITRVAPL